MSGRLYFQAAISALRSLYGDGGHSGIPFLPNTPQGLAWYSPATNLIPMAITVLVERRDVF